MEVNQQLVNAIIPILVAIVFSFAAGGATVAAVLVLVFRQILNSPVILATIEKLYLGLPPEWQEVVKGADAVLDQVTDGVPTQA